MHIVQHQGMQQAVLVRGLLCIISILLLFVCERLLFGLSAFVQLNENV